MKVLFFFSTHIDSSSLKWKSLLFERLWYSTLTSSAYTHTHVSLCKTTPGARNIAYRHATCTLQHVEYRDCVAGHRPSTSFDVSRHATCVIFVPGPGVDIGKTTSRPFIPQWRLNTSERAAAFPRYCARGCPRETREREMDEESQVVAVVSVSQTGFLSHDEKSWVFRDPFLRARCVTEIRNTKNLRSFGRGLTNIYIRIYAHLIK